MPANQSLKWATLVLWVILWMSGLYLAQHKPLGKDEAYGQILSVQKTSYTGILTGACVEGNNHPAFWVLQKLLGDALHFRLSDDWHGSLVYDEKAQIILRLLPTAFMALAGAVVFYFFASTYGLMTGAYAFLLCVPTFMFVGYWAEARPYCIWFLLTTLQTLGLVRFIEGQGNDTRLWREQSIIHVLLAFTSVFGIIQALIVSSLLWLSDKRRRGWTNYIGTAIVPVMIGLFYHWHAAFCVFWVPKPWSGLIWSNISPERFAFLCLFVLCIALYAPWRRNVQTGMNYLLIYTACVLVIALTMISFYIFLNAPHPDSFEIPARYFINLSCIGNLATALAAARLLKEFRHNRWMSVNIHIIIVGVIVMEMFRAYTMLWAIYEW